MLYNVVMRFSIPYPVFALTNVTCRTLASLGNCLIRACFARAKHSLDQSWRRSILLPTTINGLLGPEIKTTNNTKVYENNRVWKKLKFLSV